MITYFLEFVKYLGCGIDADFLGWWELGRGPGRLESA